MFPIRRPLNKRAPNAVCFSPTKKSKDNQMRRRDAHAPLFTKGDSLKNFFKFSLNLS